MIKKSFREWFTQDYLMKLNLSSQLLTGNKAISNRQEIICSVAELIINNPNKSIEDLRQDVTVGFFVSLPTALNYINESKIFIALWKKSVKP